MGWKEAKISDREQSNLGKVLGPFPRTLFSAPAILSNAFSCVVLLFHYMSPIGPGGSIVYLPRPFHAPLLPKHVTRDSIFFPTSRVLLNDVACMPGYVRGHYVHALSLFVP